jgi:hypothetical protein
MRFAIDLGKVSGICDAYDALLGALSPSEPALSCRSCRPNAPFAELVGLSKGSIADEYYAERSGNRGSASPPNFGEIYFDSAQGGHGLDFLADAGTDTAINMVVNGKTVATTTVETPPLIKIAYTGP